MIGTTLHPTIRFLRLNSTAHALDGGTIEFWSGARAAISDAPSGELQATATLATPAGTTLGLVFTFTTIGDALRVASAVITWARFKASDGSTVMDVDVGLSTSPSTPPEGVLMSNTSGVTGALLSFSTGTLQG